LAEDVWCNNKEARSEHNRQEKERRKDQLDLFNQLRSLLNKPKLPKKQTLMAAIDVIADMTAMDCLMELKLAELRKEHKILLAHKRSLEIELSALQGGGRDGCSLQTQSRTTRCTVDTAKLSTISSQHHFILMPNTLLQVQEQPHILDNFTRSR